MWEILFDLFQPEPNGRRRWVRWLVVSAAVCAMVATAVVVAGQL